MSENPAAALAPYLLVATFPACDDVDGCGAGPNEPCEPGCHSAASLEYEALFADSLVYDAASGLSGDTTVPASNL